ncbi:hypothetical protein F5Y01DRAFT_284960 [Xylaria sp. FL0043]|nr:hypothetical protein F5Y01DRAFT_284960 [Xylaria sp. FL0043]
MSILSFRALFRRFLTSKAKKSRNWNRLCLIASLWGAVLFIIGIEVPVLFQTANLPYYLGKFAYTDEYRELVHSKSTVLFGTSVFFSVLIAVQGVYFFIFWPGYDHTLVRTCVILVFVPVNLTFTWIRLMLQDDILAATIDLSKSQDYGTGLTNEEIQRKYDFIVRGMRRVGWMAAASSILLTIVQCAAVAFWIWLLPSRHRLPNRYEPVVFAKGPSWTANHGPDSIELAVLPPSDSSGRLEEIFKEHENARVLKLLPSSIGGPSTTGRRYVGRSPQGPRRHGTGPELAPDVRYWMLSNVESNLKLWVIEMAAFIVLNIGFEVPTYAIVRANGLRCPW